MNPLKSNKSVTLGLMDVFLNFMVILILALGILILFINDPVKKDNDAMVEPIGSIMIEMFWPDDALVDMDLWVKAPNDTPIGFSRKNGILFDLLRDDLGLINDLSGRNYEIAIGKNIISGEYKVSVRWYPTTSTQTTPIEVKVVVTTIIKGETSRQIISRTVTVNPNQERNMFVFRLNDDFILDRDSVYVDERLKLSQSTVEQP